MWQFIRENSFLIGALTGSLAAFLLGLLINYLRREKKWLGYSVTSRKIVEKGHPHLSLKYDDRDIARLYSNAVVVRNIGNRPLSNQPIRIESCGGGEILEHDISLPPGAKFTSNLEDAKTLLIACDLLNPGEVFTVGLTIADSTNGELLVTARGENLLCKEVSDKVTTEELLRLLSSASPISKMSLNIAKNISRIFMW